MKVKFKRLHPDAKMPTKAHDDDFCYDCYAVSEEEIAPNVWKYGLGFALQIEDKLSIPGRQLFSQCITVRPRSSVWNTGMVLSNSLGTIDEGYTGEISAVFYHVLPNMPRYRVGEKICQIHYDNTLPIEFEEVKELSPTERGDNGYGSSGK